MAIDINIESQVSQTITDGVTDKAPSENAVFDALALKIGGAVSIGQVAFGTATGVIGGDAGLTWDNTNKRLGVGTNAPSFPLDVVGQSRFSSNMFLGTTNNANGVRIIFNNSLFGRNFQIANNWNVGNTFEITPSTTVNGTVFTTPSLAINGTSGNVGIGTTSPTARLHVQAQGALSTDIGFRVRNSADTTNLFDVQGNGLFNMRWNGDIESLIINGTRSGAAAVSIGHGTNAGLRSVSIGIGNNASSIDGVAVGFNANVNTAGGNGIAFGHTITARGSNALSLGRNIVNGVGISIGRDISFSGDNNNTHFFGRGLTDTSNFMQTKTYHTFGFGSYGNTGNKPNLTYRSNGLNQLLLGYYVTDTEYSSINGTNWFGIKNGTVPDGAVDAFQQYSADIVAGNAAPHFRTENGSVIKLYKQDLPTNPTNAELATFLSNLGLANLI
jgi:hypothetical protein